MSDLEKMNGSGGNVANGSPGNGHGGSDAVSPAVQAVGSTEAAAAGSNGHANGNGVDAGTSAAGTAALKAVESAISCSSMAGDDAATDAGASSIPPSEAGGRPPLDTACSDGGGPSSLVGGMVGPPSPLTGCYLLIILGEPHSEEHKDNILQHLLKGK